MLVSELEPSVSGPEFMEQIMETLEKVDEAHLELKILSKTKNLLNQVDEKIGNHLGDNSINFHHFEHWHEAKQMWKKIKEQCKLKYGRSSILLDCKKLMKLNQAGWYCWTLKNKSRL